MVGQLTKEVADPNENVPNHYIDLDMAESMGRSMMVLTASRKCASCRKKDTQKSVARSKAPTHIKRIAEHCRDQPDFLPPEIPLKEAVFRVILSEGNKPVTAEEVSARLTSLWALGTNQRDVSAAVVQRLLDTSESYGIVREPEPEPESEDEAEEAAATSEEEAVEERPGDDDGGEAQQD